MLLDTEATLTPEEELQRAKKYPCNKCGKPSPIVSTLAFDINRVAVQCENCGYHFQEVNREDR